MSSKIVKNTSKAYGYNYASLGDIAKQGFTIPKMRVARTDGVEYVEYYEEKADQWHQGARIIQPSELEMRGMNACQRYGSALTYARRYTVLMALGLVSDEDVSLEKTCPQKPLRASTVDFSELEQSLSVCETIADIEELYKSDYAKRNLTEKTRSMVIEQFKGAKERMNAKQ